MWGKSLHPLNNFAMDEAKTFFKSKMLVKANFERGYKYFCDGYITNIWTCSATFQQTSVKASCYKSQRKNEPPHQLSVIFHLDGKIKEANCTCVIGMTEACGHLVGLCYTLQHFILKKFDEVPKELTCTDLPQKWGKPRGKKVEPESVMNMHVYAPSEQVKKKGSVACTLTRNPVMGKDNFISSAAVAQAVAELRSYNGNIGFSYLLNPEESVITTELPLQLRAQEGSVLGYQLRDWNVKDPTNTSNANSGQVSLAYKDFPIIESDRQNIFFGIAGFPSPAGVRITQEDAVNLEKKTRAQPQSNLWIKERMHRFTASNFGEIIKRKHLPNEVFLNRIFSSKDLSNVPSIMHGRKYESVARDLYRKKKPTVEVYEAGLVVTPAVCFLGASPDGHLVDTTAAGEENGVLEIKCPLWNTLNDGLEKKTGYLMLCEKTGSYILNPESNYFAQVQGQMLVSGTKWCDFVVYVHKSAEINIQRICFDDVYCADMLKKLCYLYQNYAIPFLDSVEKENHRKNV